MQTHPASVKAMGHVHGNALFHSALVFSQRRDSQSHKVRCRDMFDTVSPSVRHKAADADLAEWQHVRQAFSR